MKSFIAILLSVCCLAASGEEFTLLRTIKLPRVAGPLEKTFFYSEGPIAVEPNSGEPAFLVQHETEKRSSHWPTVRKRYLTAHPACEACGSVKNLEVHHVVPFHIDPTRELDPKNLITLCRNHHLLIGHDPDGLDGPQRPNWSRSNKNVRADAERLRRKLHPTRAPSTDEPKLKDWSVIPQRKAQ